MKVVVLGASPNPLRYSHVATLRLMEAGHEVIPIGQRSGKIDELEIQTHFPYIRDVDVVTLYIGPKNQPPLFDYLLELRPKKVIMNPGTENPDLETLLLDNNIQVEVACTLVMLSVGNF